MLAGRKIAEELRALEARLMDPRVRHSPSEVDRLLAEDFVEFGSSGRVYDKARMIAALRREPGFDGARTIVDFEARELAPSVVLVTYRIGETATLRSSIWRSNGAHWEIVFHQGTRSASE